LRKNKKNNTNNNTQEEPPPFFRTKEKKLLPTFPSYFLSLSTLKKRWYVVGAFVL